MRMMVVIAALALAGPAWAQAKCAEGSASVLRLVSWKSETAAPDKFGLSGMTLQLEQENVTGKPIRMIEGSTRFYDALGAFVGGVALPKDKFIPAAGRTQESRREMGMLERLPKLRPSEVTAITCVGAVVYDDGQVQKW